MGRNLTDFQKLFLVLACIFVAVAWSQPRSPWGAGLERQPMNTGLGNSTQAFAIAFDATVYSDVALIGMNYAPSNNQTGIAFYNVTSGITSNTTRILLSTTRTPGGVVSNEGVFARDGLFISPNSSPRRAIACLVNGFRYALDINLDSGTAFFAFGFNSSQPATINRCIVDWQRGFLWMTFNNRFTRASISPAFPAPLANGNGPWGVSSAQSLAFTNNAITSVAMDANRIYWANDVGAIHIVLRNVTTVANTTIHTTITGVGIGRINSLILDAINNFMFVGCNNGVWLRQNISAIRVNPEIFFDPALPTTAVSAWVDPVMRNLFIVQRSQIAIARVKYDPFVLTDIVVNVRATVGPNSNQIDNTDVIRFFAPNSVTNTNGRPLALLPTTGTPSFVARVVLYDCAVRTSCRACLQDTEYCGWCVETSTCVSRGLCSNNATYIDVDNARICPVVLSSQPSTMPTFGNLNVTLTANALPAANALHFCGTTLVNGTTVFTNVTSYDAVGNTFSCLLPNLDMGLGNVSVFLSFNRTRQLLDSVAIPTYNCSSTSCASCFDPSRPLCNWCLSSGTCLSLGQTAVPCNGYAINRTCPVLTGTLPPQVNHTGTPITVSASQAVSGPLTCRFEPVNALLPPVNSTAVFGGGNSWVCQLVAFNDSYHGQYRVRLVHTSSGIFYAGDTFTTIFVYSCSRATTCETCLLGQCDWALDQVNTPCRQLNAGPPPNSVQVPALCPRLVSLSPSSVPINGAAEVSLSIRNFVNNPALYECALYGQNDTVLTTPVDVTNLIVAGNLSSVRCPLNTTGVPNANAQLGVRLKGSPARDYSTDRLPFLVYDCSVYTTCNTCHDAVLRPLCGWCAEGHCASTSTTCRNNATASTGTCPTIGSLAPTLGFYRGNTVVTINVNGLIDPPPSADGYRCRFDNQTVNATVVSPGVLSCTTPGVAIDVTSVAVSIEATSAVSSQSFEYTTSVGSPSAPRFNLFQCGMFNGNCTECQLRTECDYCAPFTCTESGEPLCAPEYLLTNTQCPQATLELDHFPANELVQLIFVGGPFFLDLDYVCIAQVTAVSANGTVLPTQVVSSVVSTVLDFDRVECDFDPLPMSSVQVMLFGEPDVTYLYQTPLVMDVFDCSFNESGSSCAQCAANPSPYCGWCFDQSAAPSCNHFERCQTFASAGEYFINDTSVCPELVSASPSFIPRLRNASIELQVAGPVYANADYSCLIRVPPLQLSVPASITDVDRVSCAINPFALFGNRTTQVSESAQVDLYLFGRRFSSELSVQSVSFLDCTTRTVLEQRCPLCLAKHPQCSWCQIEGSCELPSYCNSTFASVTARNVSECITVQRLDPVQLPLEGGSVSVIGINFVDLPRFFCVFSGQRVQATFGSASSMSCLAPAVEEAAAATFDFQLDNRSLLLSELQLSYAAAVTTKLSGGAIGGIAGALLFCCIVVAILVIIGYVVYKKRLAKKKLGEPNYEFLAVGTVFSEYKVESSKREGYDKLAKLMREGNFQIPTILAEIISNNELDRLCRALVWSQENGVTSHGLDIVNRFISEEISKLDGDDSTSLFRQTAPATKMVTHYEKLIGLRYLWETLAVPVHELNDLALQEMAAQTGETGGMLSGNNDMSRYVTPSNRSATSSSFYRSTSFEIDPSKMDDKNKAFLNENVIRLMLYAQHLFNAIITNVPVMPKQLRQMYRYARDRLSSKYPQHERKAVSSLLFLRFICPSLLTPHVWGLLEEPPVENASRYLILLSKTLHNLSTGTLPGQKEAYMQKLNEFITMNQDAFRDLTDTITSKEEIDKLQTEEVNLPPEVHYQACAFLHNVLVQEKDAILQRLMGGTDDSPFDDDLNATSKNTTDRVADKLKEVLTLLGTPTKPKNAKEYVPEPAAPSDDLIRADEKKATDSAKEEEDDDDKDN